MTNAKVIVQNPERFELISIRKTISEGVLRVDISQDIPVSHISHICNCSGPGAF